MKKISITIAAIALIAFGSYAQTDEADLGTKITFGVKAGANLSNVYDSEGEQFNADAKVGFAGGVFVGIPIGQYLGVQPELLFSQKGFKGSGSLLGSEYNFTRTTDYIDIPLLIAIKPSPYVTILAGPQYSYLLKQKDSFTSSASSVVQEEEFDNDNLRKNILGIVGGLDLNMSNLVIGLRVGWDLTQNHGDGTSSTPRYKNLTYEATVGFRL
jgi:hypothetical protein